MGKRVQGTPLLCIVTCLLVTTLAIPIVRLVLYVLGTPRTLLCPLL